MTRDRRSTFNPASLGPVLVLSAVHELVIQSSVCLSELTRPAVGQVQRVGAQRHTGLKALLGLIEVLTGGKEAELVVVLSGRKGVGLVIVLTGQKGAGLVVVLTVRIGAGLVDVLTCLKVLTKDLLDLNGVTEPVEVVGGGKGVWDLAEFKIKLKYV